jgi:uncharacterized membrane protein
MDEVAHGPLPESMYHKAVGWRAPPLRRILIVAGVGLLMTAVMWPAVQWELAVLVGWDAGAFAFLATVGPIIVRADGRRTEAVAMTEDETRRTAAALVVAACVASLLAVLFTLAAAGRQAGGHRLLLIGGATLTVVVSWMVINTIFTLRYADLHYQTVHEGGTGVDFGGSDRPSPDDPAVQPDFRDFAYVAFTIGMCYQVSDTNLRSRHLRRTVLAHAAISYVFGVVIVAAGINLIAGLIQ